ncbi:MAG: PilX N-terminal domain-containing pilus assembly protein [bacterium]|nr:hypothetical protein [Pseudomonadales bacterium]
MYLSSQSKQSGVVLVITLVTLLILTVLGTSSVRITGLAERIARNSVDSDVAFRAAEAAIQVAEQVIEAEIALTPYEANSNGKYEAHNVGESPIWEDETYWQGVKSVQVDYSDGYAKPRYVIEFIETVLTNEDRLNLDNVGGSVGADRTQVFRITALGTGRTESAKVLLQSTYGKEF